MAELPKSQRPAGARTRWRPRAFPILITVFSAITIAWFFESQATTTIIFVRHADTDPAVTDARGLMAAGTYDAEGSPGPALSARGRARAELLAQFLQDVDVVAGVDAIFASEFSPTQATAAPLASRLGLEVAIADPYEPEAFMQHVLRAHKGDVVLVVTHNDTIAPLIEELHGSKRVPAIAPDEYDNLYIVAVPWFARVKTLRFRYGLAASLDDLDRLVEFDSGPRTQVPQFP